MKKIIILLGAPGSGKGTQAQLIGAKLNIPLVSVGALCREAVAAKTKIGKAIDKVIGGGNLAPVEMSNALLKKRLSKKDVQTGFVLDGYPRSTGQLEYAQEIIDKVLSKGGKVFVFYIDINDATVRKRIEGRRTCSSCGLQFHTTFSPPQKRGACDDCGSALIQRTDDAPKSVTQRLKVFHKETGPVLDHFDKSDYFYRINGDRKIDVIHKNIFRILNKK